MPTITIDVPAQFEQRRQVLGATALAVYIKGIEALESDIGQLSAGMDRLDKLTDNLVELTDNQKG